MVRITLTVLLFAGSGAAEAQPVTCANRACVIAGAEDYPRCPAIDVATARRLAGQGPPPRLQKLAISAGGRAMEILAASRWLDGVDELDMCTDDRGLRAIVAAAKLRPRTLRIASPVDPIETSTVRALVRSRRIGRRLEVLTFAAGDSEAERTLQRDAGRALAGARLPRLRRLDLGWTAIDSASVIALVESQLAHQLEKLDLCQTALDAAVATALVDAQLTKLQWLCISNHVSEPSDVPRARVQGAYGAVLDPGRYGIEGPGSIE